MLVFRDYNVIRSTNTRNVVFYDAFTGVRRTDAFQIRSNVTAGNVSRSLLPVVTSDQRKCCAVNCDHPVPLCSISPRGRHTPLHAAQVKKDIGILQSTDGVTEEPAAAKKVTRAASAAKG